MKTRHLAAFVFLSSIILFSGCGKDEKKKEISASEAKTELRTASQSISVEMESMMNKPAMVSLDFLTQLMDNGDWKSNLKNLAFNSGKLHLAKVKSAFRHNSAEKGATEVGDFGIYRFNFLLDDFELVENSTTSLQLTFPADEAAYAAQQNNAVLLLDNLSYKTISYTETYYDEYMQTWVTETYEEMVPTNVSVALKLDDVSQMTMTYTASYDDSGFPTGMTASMNMAPYEFQTSLSGSGTDFNTSLTFKESGNVLMAYDWDLHYSSDMTELTKAIGSQTVTPLKAEGWMNMAAIQNHMDEVDMNQGSYDLNFLNNQLDMELSHTGINAKIGDIEFRMYTDTEYNETYPELAIVYSDGSYEWLADILNDSSFKYHRVR